MGGRSDHMQSEGYRSDYLRSNGLPFRLLITYDNSDSRNMDLEERALRVISVMKEIPELAHLKVNELTNIPLGTLREGTYNLQGACRWRKGIWQRFAKGTDKGPSEVRCVDLHPLLLTEEWSRLGDFVLFHEYLHALLPPGESHGGDFRLLEELWPDSEAIAMTDEFNDFIRERRSDILKCESLCPNCGWKWRSKKSIIGLRCMKCNTTMENIEPKQQKQM